MKLEEKILTLQEIASKLENPDLGLEESMELYEKGCAISKECYSSINEIKGKINIIKKDIESFREETFE